MIKLTDHFASIRNSSAVGSNPTTIVSLSEEDSYSNNSSIQTATQNNETNYKMFGEEIQEDEEDSTEEIELITADKSSQFSILNQNRRRLIIMRKKREPSLKLKQKLSNSDLELIVNAVKNQQAKCFIADIKKDSYIDKILRVKIIDQDLCLSNCMREALLKKTMFPKDMITHFDTFVSALCGQALDFDALGNQKPILKCLVEDCGFKSFSEAEIMRHIKRHLAQDGYTCTECMNQFASMTNLQRHMKIHSGVNGKEVKCPHCDYKASTLTHVKRHMAHKHLERSLPCPHCSFMGATNAELKIHLARKHLELTGKNPLFLPKYLRKDYKCGVCKEQFNDFKVKNLNLNLNLFSHLIVIFKKISLRSIKPMCISIQAHKIASDVQNVHTIVKITVNSK
jgi:DNA-directed RNA polymerase subunit RPC12/RpoP